MDIPSFPSSLESVNGTPPLSNAQGGATNVRSARPMGTIHPEWTTRFWSKMERHQRGNIVLMQYQMTFFISKSPKPPIWTKETKKKNNHFHQYLSLLFSKKKNFAFDEKGMAQNVQSACDWALDIPRD